MNKNIKQLVEDYLSFNPKDLEDDKPKNILATDIINNSLYHYIPQTKEELVKTLKRLFNSGVKDLNCIDVSNITDFSEVFKGYDMNNIDISDWDVSKGKNFIEMFAFTKNFTCDLNSWDIKYRGRMQRMFLGCESFMPDMIESWNLPEDILQNITKLIATDTKTLKKYIKYFLDNNYKNLNFIDVSQVTDFSKVFYRKNMEDIDISDWDVSNGTDFSHMFDNAVNFNCSLRNWDVSNGTNFDHMFCGAKKFFTDLSTWDIKPNISLDYLEHGTYVKYMFWDFEGNITSLPKALDTPDFSTSNVNEIFGWAEFIENPHPEKMLGKN